MNQELTPAAAGAYLLLADRVQAYLQSRGRAGDTSLRTETARELLTSLEYTLSLSPGPDPAQSYAHGLAILRRREREVWDLLRLVRATAPEDGGLFGALTEIEAFLRGYEPELFAHLRPPEPDYAPLLPPPGELLGVDWVRAYLDRLWLENQFLAAFSPEELAACWDTSLGLGGPPENLAEKPLLHGLGRALLSPGPLPLAGEDLEALATALARPGALDRGLDRLCRELPARVREYLAGYLPGLALRLEGPMRRGDLTPVFYGAE